MKQKNIIFTLLIVGVLVAIGIIAAKYLVKRKGANEEGGDNGSSGSGSSGGSSSTQASFPLRRGSKGKQVTQLQRWLNANTGGLIYDTADGLIYVSAHNSVGVDGRFGPATEKELMTATGRTEVSQQFFNSVHMNSL